VTAIFAFLGKARRLIMSLRSMVKDVVDDGYTGQWCRRWNKVRTSSNRVMYGVGHRA
jgi:hypothetical protein